MIWELDFWLMLLLLTFALMALEVRDLLVAVTVLTGYSFLMALLFAELGAPDVALTEAALGAGLTGVFFLVTLLFVKRESGD
ncbi:MAG: hydrogenase subunit MbhD domain-containing protein [Gemmatimonadota bacterium]